MNIFLHKKRSTAYDHFFLSLLVFLFLISFNIQHIQAQCGAGAVDQIIIATNNGGTPSTHNVYFMGKTVDNGNNTSTWEYCFESGGGMGGAAIDHFVIGSLGSYLDCLQPGEASGNNTSGCTPPEFVDPDQNTDVWGLKWDCNFQAGDCICITFTLNDDYPAEGEIFIGIQAGAAASIGRITGPLCLTPTPVELAYFSVQAKETNVELSWGTTSEENNLGFEIQRKSEISNWETIDFVDGNGTISESIFYNYLDRSPYSGPNYYRLKQIDFDGKYEFSDIRHVDMELEHEAPIQVFPNPTSESFNVRIHNPNQKRTSAKLFNSTGMLIWEGYWEAEEMPEYWYRTFDIKQQDIYILVTQIGNQIQTQRIAVLNID